MRLIPGYLRCGGPLWECLSCNSRGTTFALRLLPSSEAPHLVLQDRSFMRSPAELKFDPITAGCTYILWLGGRKQIEEQTTT